MLAGAVAAVVAAGLLITVARRAGPRWAVMLTCLGLAVASAAAAILLPPEQSAPRWSWTALNGQPRSTPVAHGYTDPGRSIELTECSDDDFPVAQSQADEDLLGRNHPFTLIRTTPPDPASNCHGWVFTGGRYWVRDSAVDQILADNGYHEVTEPRAGDLIVYRGASGEVAHTGVVRVAGDLVLVEGKWGSMGCYLHAPDQYPYGYSWSFYRSPRRGHLLRLPGD
jgi:hypothetical protein